MAAVALGVWLASVAAWEMLRPAGANATLCQVKQWTGYPCPTCGTTRAALAAARGDVIGALTWNPLMTALGLIGGVLLVMRLLTGRRVQIELDEQPLAWRLAVGPVVIALTLNWAWLISRGV